MFWIFIAIFVVIFILAAVSQGNSNTKEFEKSYGFKTSDLISSDNYVSGHPLLDKSFGKSFLLIDKDEVKIFEFSNSATTWVLKSHISKSLITNVIIEDASTMQQRITAGRLLLVGVFAFAWKKNKKAECAYLIIKWKQGNFDNETIFELSGTGSISRANTIRNKFINYLS